jgi:hypothetical protein
MADDSAGRFPDAPTHRDDQETDAPHEIAGPEPIRPILGLATFAGTGTVDHSDSEIPTGPRTPPVGPD